MFGLKNKEVMQKLLTKDLDKLTLDHATEVATAFEAVQRSQVRMQPDVSEVSYVSKKTRPVMAESQDRDTCSCCGKTNHVKSKCRFRDRKCHACGTMGHLKAVCRQRYRKESSFEVRAVENAKMKFLPLVMGASTKM